MILSNETCDIFLVNFSFCSCTNFLFLFANFRRKRTCFDTKSAKLKLATLARRRVNAIIMFVHSIITGKYNSPYLRSMMIMNDGARILRQTNFIKLNTYDNSPFNIACRMFNAAVRNIDPTQPRNQFRTALLKLPDNLFEEWTKL